jgi:enamine deaminase RidA (YjgF/YER057c/UK114 family)
MFEQKLNELGIIIPEAPKPLASYIPAVKSGNLIFTSGQLPIKEGKLLFVGKVGAEISEDDAMKAAEVCAINCISAAKTLLNSINQIKRVIKVSVFVASASGFIAQPKVANGASDLMVKIFGEFGKHSRCAVGVAELPLNAPVEIEMIFEV